MSPAPTRPDQIGRAIVLTMLTVGAFGIQDAISKHLLETYSPFFITMLRYWGFSVFALILVARQAPLRYAFRSRVPAWQVFRGVLLMFDIWFFLLALRSVPLGELQAIVVIYPLLVTLFAIPILGERVGIFRFTAVGAGFLGALIVVRPGGVPLDWGVFFAVVSATTYALYIVITRKVSQHDSPATSMTYSALIGLALSTLVGVFFWQPMPVQDMALVGAIIATTCIGHGLMVYALTMAPASTLQPFNYFSLPWAITLSIIFFGHWIDAVSLFGAAVIVAAGLVVMAREHRRNRAAKAQTPPLAEAASGEDQRLARISFRRRNSR